MNIINWNNNQKQEFLEVGKNFIIDMTDIKLYHQAIKEHYLGKAGNALASALNDLYKQYQNEKLS